METEEEKGRERELARARIAARIGRSSSCDRETKLDAIPEQHAWSFSEYR